MNLAVVKTGGKQYVVSAGDTIRVEKLVGDAGATVAFDEVLLVGDDKTVTVGLPTVAAATVTATIVKQGRADKITVVKYKNKTRYRRTLGHRQSFTEVKIESIA